MNNVAAGTVMAAFFFFFPFFLCRRCGAEVEAVGWAEGPLSFWMWKLIVDSSAILNIEDKWISSVELIFVTCRDCDCGYYTIIC